VSALTDRELPAAQEGLVRARAALAALHERLSTGDATVTGADLSAAEADIRAAELLESGARQRDMARAEVEHEIAARAALDELVDSYRSTSAEVSTAVVDALGSLGRLLDACQRNEATTSAKLRAATDASGDLSNANPLTRRQILGFGRLHRSEPVVIARAVLAEALHRGGVGDSVYPAITREPLAPFLGQ